MAFQNTISGKEFARRNCGSMSKEKFYEEYYRIIHTAYLRSNGASCIEIIKKDFVENFGTDLDNISISYIYATAKYLVYDVVVNSLLSDGKIDSQYYFNKLAIDLGFDVWLIQCMENGTKMTMNDFFNWQPLVKSDKTERAISDFWNFRLPKSHNFKNLYGGIAFYKNTIYEIYRKLLRANNDSEIDSVSCENILSYLDSKLGPMKYETEKLAEAVADAVAAISIPEAVAEETFAKAAEEAVEVVEKTVETVEDTVNETVDAVEETVEEAVSETVDTVVETVEETVAETIDTVDEKVEETVEEVVEKVETIEETVEETAEVVVEEAAETVDTVEELLTENVETAEETVENVIEDTTETVETTIETVEEATEEAVAETVETIENTVEETVTETVDTVEETVEEVLEETVEAVEKTIDVAEDLVEEAVVDTIEAVAAVEIVETAEEIAETLEEAAETFEETAAEAVEETVDESVERTLDEAEEITEENEAENRSLIDEAIETIAAVKSTIVEETEQPEEVKEFTEENVQEELAEAVTAIGLADAVEEILESDKVDDADFFDMVLENATEVVEIKPEEELSAEVIMNNFADDMNKLSEEISETTENIEKAAEEISASVETIAPKPVIRVVEPEDKIEKKVKGFKATKDAKRKFTKDKAITAAVCATVAAGAVLIPIAVALLGKGKRR